MPLAARPYRTALAALRRAGDREAVVCLSGKYVVIPAGEADELDAAGVTFARVTAAPRGGPELRDVSAPFGDDG